MRGFVVITVTIVVLVVAQLVGSAAVVPLGEHIKSVDGIDNEQDAVIDSVYDVVFKWMPLILGFGMIGGWGVAWYLRKERSTQQRPGGGFS